MAYPDVPISAGTSTSLTADDLRWLQQLAAVMPHQVLLPMRKTEKFGKLGLIELRSATLTLTDRGRQALHASPAA